MQNQLIAFALALYTLCVAGCTQQVKLDESDQKFIAVYADVLVLQGSYAAVGDSLREFFSKSDSLNALFAAHAYSPETFVRQFERYRTDPKRWQEIQMRTLQILEERRNLILQEKQDTINRKIQMQ